MTDVTKEKILETARRLAYQNNEGGVSLAIIAKEVGIKKPSIYYYFDSKEELYKELFRESFTDLRLKFEEIESEKDPRERIKKMIILAIEHMHFVQFMAERYNFEFLHKKMFMQKREEFIKKIAMAIEDYTGEKSKYPRETALSLIGAIGTICLDKMFFKKEKINSDDLAEKILRIILK